MPNNKGGKNYKKSKHASEMPILYEREEGQMYARVTKILGNCNLMVYCNDGRERMCHIRGNMRKRVWLGVGDIILISVREYNTEEPGKLGRGDVCVKYDPSVLSRLKQKDPSINPKLFENLKSSTNEVEDDGFIFEDNDNTKGRDDEESENDSSEEEIISSKPIFSKNRKAYGNMMTHNKDDDEDDIDIDNI
jgi:translation initiation factor 1A